MTSFSRRDFLKVAGLGAAYASLVALTACAKGGTDEGTTGGSTGTSTGTGASTGTAGGSTTGSTSSTGSTGSTPAPAEDESHMGGEFHRAYGFLGNFWQAYSQASQVEYCWPVLEPLAKKPSATLVWKPCLAESWETDPDACTFTVKIRDGVTFSDGSPFTVDDAVFSLSK